MDKTKLFIKQRADMPANLHTAPPPGRPSMPNPIVHTPDDRPLPDKGDGIAGSGGPCGSFYSSTQYLLCGVSLWSTHVGIMRPQMISCICYCCNSLVWLLRDACAHAGHDRRPTAAFRPATSPKHRLTHLAAPMEEAAASWSLALTTRKDSPVRMRRPLYEALLRLEAEGAAVVDRRLRAEDLALSAGTCCCIWTEDSLKVRPLCLPEQYSTHHRGRWWHAGMAFCQTHADWAFASGLLGGRFSWCMHTIYAHVTKLIATWPHPAQASPPLMD